MRGPLVKLPSQRFEDPAQIVKSSDWLINVRLVSPSLVFFCFLFFLILAGDDLFITP